MNYEDMTESQIDVAVMNAIKGNICWDYCFEWDVTGPLMQDNKISLLWDDNLLAWSASGDAEHPSHGFIKRCEDWGASPLRCICIVFLMMQDAIKELDK